MAFGSIAQVIEPNVDVDGNGIVAENVIIETKYSFHFSICETTFTFEHVSHFNAIHVCLSLNQVNSNVEINYCSSPSVN